MRAAAVAAAVALAVSGCSTVVTGRPVAESGGTGAGAPRWVDVSGESFPLRVDDRGMQFSPDGAPYPGASIRHANPDMPSGFERCTVGPAVTGPDGVGFLTAGHCATPVPEQELQTDAAATTFVPMGTATDAEVSNYGGDDTALVPARLPGSGSATRIADSFPVAGVMTEDAVRALPVGTPICMNGAVDGVVCGPLTQVNPDIQFRRPTPPIGGDSGSTVFMVDGVTRSAVLIGILHGRTAEDASVAAAAPLEPSLLRLGVRAMLDPTTVPLVGPNYVASS